MGNGRVGWKEKSGVEDRVIAAEQWVLPHEFALQK
jgi:hypothetical protein